MVYTHVLNGGRQGVRRPLAACTSRLQRERWDHPDRPVGITGAKLWNTQEVSTNKVVAARFGVGDFVLGRPGPVLSRSA